MATRNSMLHGAKRNKKDEFYTQLNDISAELYHYRHHLRGKKIFLNCDDPEWSNFWRYFELNFIDLGLEQVVSTHYDPEEPTYKLTMRLDENGDLTTIKEPLEGNGDFRSAECIELLDEADIITTNPPFSLFREYVAQLIEHNKHFIILGNVNAISYKEFFPLLKDNKVWIGASIHSGDRAFYVPDDYPLKASGCGVDPDTGRKFIRVKGVRWYTNLDIDQRHRPLTLWKDYDPTDNPKYDNYDAINVDKVSEIPCDYYGVMGVPITFMDKYCPEQFEILDGRDYALYDKQKRKGTMLVKDADGAINGKPKYARILIRRVDQPDEQDDGE